MRIDKSGYACDERKAGVPMHNMEEKNLALAALMATAQAFYSRGENIQYDQLSMDRILRVTPRRNLYAVPEEATQQHTVFLDCSSFVFACFYQAFGYSFPADLTKDMIELEELREFYYEITGLETEEEKRLVLEAFHKALLPGDVIVFVYEGNGHTLLCGQGGALYHCTTNGRPSSYDYENAHDNRYPQGGLNCVSDEMLFRLFEDEGRAHNYLFRSANKAFCVLRPLKLGLVPTEQTLCRMEGLQNLVVETLCSHPEGRMAQPGERVSYTVIIRNKAEETRAVTLRLDGCEERLPIGPGEEIRLKYCYLADQLQRRGAYLIPPKILVNGVCACPPRVLWGRKGEQKLSDITQRAAEERLNSLFDPLEDNQGMVYRLNKERAVPCGLVPGLYGGLGVITPEIETSRHCRIRRATTQALEAGDAILYRDKLDSSAEWAVYQGGGRFVGRSAEESARFMDGLFAKYCFAVCREATYGL